MIFWLSCIALSLWIVRFRYRRRQMYKLAAKISSCQHDLPVIGIAHKLVGTQEDIMATLKQFNYDAMKNGGIMKGWLNHILYFLVLHPGDLEKVLKTCLEKDDLHRFLRNCLGNGGLVAPLNIWRRRRKILVPAFSPRLVESFFGTISEQSEILTKRLTDRSGKGKFSVWPFVNAYTMDSISHTAMGVILNSQSNPNTPFLFYINRILHLVCQRIFHLWLQPDWLYRLFPQSTEHQESIKQLHDYTDEVIRKKREELRIESKTKTEVDSAYDLENYKNKSFLDHLIHLSGNEDGYTDRELREEILTLTIAGTDTSAITIGNTLKMLAKYPEVQKRVYEEIYDVFRDSDRRVVKEDLHHLKYLERVVKETLRLFPPVPFIVRKVEEDIKLPSGVELPAGSGVVASIWGIHRNPEYWGPDAEKFDPDRFLPERFSPEQACSYMPFSQGPRNCIGFQYGMMSVNTAVTSILRKFKVVPDPEKSDIPYIRVKLEIMMKDVEGYQIALELREPERNNNVITSL